MINLERFLHDEVRAYLRNVELFADYLESVSQIEIYRSFTRVTPDELAGELASAVTENKPQQFTTQVSPLPLRIDSHPAQLPVGFLRSIASAAKKGGYSYDQLVIANGVMISVGEVVSVPFAGG